MPIENQQPAPGQEGPYGGSADPLNIPRVTFPGGGGGGGGTGGATSPVYDDTNKPPKQKTLADYFQEQLGAIQALSGGAAGTEDTFTGTVAPNKQVIVPIPKKSNATVWLILLAIAGGFAYWIWKKQKHERE